MTKNSRDEAIEDPNAETEDAANASDGPPSQGGTPSPDGDEAESSDPPAPDAAAEAATESGEEPDPLAAREAEIATLKDQLLRALAEVENTRRRAQRDREEAQLYGPTALARDLLGVADNLRRAIESVDPATAEGNDAVRSLLSGVELIERELQKVLERHHIARIEAEGAKFDAHLHQAMFEVPDAGAEPGTVVQVLQPGYVLHDRLLRAAMVGIAKAPAPGTAREPAESDS